MPIVAALIVSAGAILGIFLGAAFAAERVTAQLEENRAQFEDQLEENRRLSKEQMDENRRLAKEQLDAEADRLQMQLDAAEKGLELQLNADRENQNRAELRDVLDSGAELLANANDQMYEALSQARRAEKRDWQAGEQRAEKSIAAAGNLFETLNALGSYWQRLLLHFNIRDGITKAVEDAMDGFRDGMGAVNVPRKELDADRLSTLDEKHGEFNDAYVDFLRDCRKRFGVGGD